MVLNSWKVLWRMIDVRRKPDTEQNNLNLEQQKIEKVTEEIKMVEEIKTEETKKEYQGYCVKCKKMVTIVTPTLFKNKRGVNCVAGTCPAGGNKVFCILGNKA